MSSVLPFNGTYSPQEVKRPDIIVSGEAIISSIIYGAKLYFEGEYNLCLLNDYVGALTEDLYLEMQGKMVDICQSEIIEYLEEQEIDVGLDEGATMVSKEEVDEVIRNEMIKFAPRIMDLLKKDLFGIGLVKM